MKFFVIFVSEKAIKYSMSLIKIALGMQNEFYVATFYKNTKMRAWEGSVW
jgi:restriction endonuclease